MVKFEHVLLGLLAMRPYSGYDLRKWLEVEGRFLWSSAHHSQIYRALKRMGDVGWVRFEVDPREGRPDAKVYRITPSGRQVLLEWIRSPYEPPSRFQESGFTARFGFAMAFDPDAALALVETELAYRREQVARNRGRDRTLRFEDPIPELDPARAQAAFDRLHAAGAAAVDQWIDWLEDTRRRLKEGDPR